MPGENGENCVFCMFRKMGRTRGLPRNGGSMNKLFNRKWAVRLLAVMLITALSLSNVTASAFSVGLGSQSSTSTVSQLGISDVTDQVSSFDISNYALTDNTYQRFSSEDLIWVVVQLKDDSLVDRYLSRGKGYASVKDYAASRDAQSYLSSLAVKQKELISEFGREIEITTSYSYTTILNGFAAQIRYKDLEYLEKHSKVDNVIISETYARPQYEVTTNDVNVYGTGIYDSSDVDYNGEGTIVAVLDTGLDYTHTAFQQQPQGNVALTRDDVDALVNDTTAAALSAGRTEDAFTLSTDQVYLSKKVPFAYDYADKDADVYPYEDHGTHVAGIIAGQDDEITGVATEAQLAIMKVFPSDDDSGAETQDILAALSDCVLLNVDAINMSLGSSAGFTRESDEEGINEIYDSIRDTGICLIVAASNDGSSAQQGRYGDTNLTSNPDSGTVGSPASYEAAMAIASISGVKTKYMVANGDTPVYITDSSTIAGDKNDFIGELMNRGYTTLEYVTVPGLGQSADYLGLDLEGKVALVRRGTSTFEDKIKMAQSKGAIACIIYNNVTGTINMSVGKTSVIPSCSIDLETGTALASRASGTLVLSQEYEAGPFMSDFSSWGVLPNLELKPDITAHGGDIYSAVRGGYDRISGTSMACPNMAGATILVREYVKQAFPDLTNVEITELTYQLMMSTATIANNQEGNPYSPRKQGAGLADIKKAIETSAYLWVEGENKTKLSLGDDKEKTGVYELNFKLTNLSKYARSYTVLPYIMTETVSVDGKTVAEKAHMFTDSGVTVKVNGKTVTGSTVSVSGYRTADITITISLTDAEKAYLDANFVNGMYVEGFIRLLSQDEDVDLSIPYLAFYGDWTKAPMLDVTAYEVGESEMDSSVVEKDKLQPDVYATLPMGAYKAAISAYETEDQIWGLGEYGYRLSTNYYETVTKPATVEEHASISTNESAFYKLDYIYAGLLRGSKETYMTVTDNATGEVIFEKTYINARKSVYTGGRRPGFIEVDLNANEYNLRNNSTYTFFMEGKLDYPGEHTTERTTFSFEFTVDSESPVLRDDLTNIRIVRDSSGNFRYYLDMYVYDNHYLQAYTMSSISGITASGTLLDQKSLFNMTVPINGGCGVTNVITYELTDVWNDLISSGRSIYVEFLDYAKNTSAFEVKLPEVNATDFTYNRTSATAFTIGLNESMELAKFVDVDLTGAVWTSEDESKVTVDQNGKVTGIAKTIRDGSTIDRGVNVIAQVGRVQTKINVKVVDNVKTFTVRTNEYVNLKDSLTLYPLNGRYDLLEWTSEDENIAEVYDGLVYGKSAGTVTINVTSKTGQTLGVEVVVREGTVETPTASGIELSHTSLRLDQGEEYELDATIIPWNLSEQPELVWSSGTPSVVEVISTEGNKAVIKARNEGSCYITVSLKDRPLISAVCRVTVNQVYEVEGVYLRSYTGRGDENGEVVIPSDLGIRYIYMYAFFGNEYVTKVTLPDGCLEVGEAAFYGMENLQEVVLNEDCEKLSKWAFGWNPSLRKINLDNVVTVAELCFYNCPMLSEVDLYGVHFIGERAFQGDISLTELNIQNVGYMGNFAFARCTGLTQLNMSQYTQIGDYSFYGCSGLTRLAIPTDNVGEAAFYQCSSLIEVTFTGDVDLIDQLAFYYCRSLEQVSFMGSVRRIGTAAFADCNQLKEITLPDGLEQLGEQAFVGDTALTTVNIAAGAKLTEIQYDVFGSCTNLSTFQVAEGNSYLSSDRSGILFDKSKTTIVLAPVNVRLTNYSVPTTVKAIGDYAFSNLTSLSTVTLNNVVHIGEGAFQNCTGLTRVTFNTSSTALKSIGDMAFFGCTSLRSIALPEGLETIGESAFAGCSYAAAGGYTLTVPDSVTEIGYNAFRMMSMTKLVIGTGVTSLPMQMAAQCTRLTEVEFRGDNVETIGGYAFTLCTSLTSFTVPDSVKQLGEYAFAACTGLNEVVLSSSMTEIPAGCFAGCSSLVTYTVPDQITSVGASAFGAFSFYTSEDSAAENYFCSSLTTVDLNNVEAIGSFAFQAADKLTQVSADNLKDVGEGAFYGAAALETISLPRAQILRSGAFTECVQLKNVQIPSVTAIESYAFYRCSALESIALPAAVGIGADAFSECEKLTSVSMPVVQTIGDRAFSHANLSGLELPATLKTIGIEAFQYNDNLNQVTVAQDCANYFVENGVLYRNLPNGGYELTLYPVGLTAQSYTVKAGTVRIDEGAFIGQQSLQEVRFPESLTNIGHEAFYRTTVTRYEFSSTQAPRLESKFSQEDLDNEKYLGYTNFVDSIYAADSLGLELVCPANGTGYDEFIWTTYFSTVTGTEAASASGESTVSNVSLADPAAGAQQSSLQAAAAAGESSVSEADRPFLWAAVVGAAFLLSGGCFLVVRKCGRRS